MVKRKHRYLSLLTVLIMLMSLLSGFTVQAEGDPEEQQLAGGLALGWVQFDEGTETHFIDPSNMGDGMWFDAKTIGEFTIGWRHADGTLTAFTDADWEYLAFTDQEDQPVNVDIQPLMESYLDEGTDRWEERRAGDGMYTAYFQSPGEYKLTYTGALTEETFPEGKEPFTIAGISVSMPLVAAYSDAEATEETLLGSQIHYGTDYFFYVIAGSTGDEQHRTTASIAEINFFDERVRDLVEVEEIEAGVSYKLTVSEMQDYPFNFQAVVDFAEYDYNGTQFELVDERREDRWFDCYTPERYGFAADWTQFEQEEPVFDGDRLGSALYDYEIMADNTFTFGWKGLNDEVTPVPLEDLDKISIYDEYDEVPEDAYISAATRWDDQLQDEVPLGDGFFNMWIGTPGIYTITYDSGEELTPPDGAIISESITLYAVMPHVSLFSTDEYSLDTLIGPRADYTEDQREFYINKKDDVAEDWKTLYTITDMELQGASDVADYVTIEEAGDSYKVSIADNYTEHFNIRVIFTTTEYRYEDEDWQLSNEWDRDYWIDFDYWEPTPFGFMIGWPYFDPADPDAPPVYPDVLFYGMGAEAKTLATIALGWMDAEGNVTPIPQTDIDKLHLFDPDGNEVISEWISIPYRWDEEAQEDVPLNIDGIFDVNFPGTGIYIMTLDKDITGIEVPEGMAVETAFPMNIEYPTIGIYDSTEVSDDSLLGKNVSFTDGNELVYYIQVTDHIDSQNRMERSITDYQIEAPEGFEDVADELATIEEISDHILKVTIAEDCYVGFDVTVTATTTNQHFDWQTQTWEYDDETWLDEDRLGFWYYEKGSVSVNLTADGATPEGTVIFLENTDTETYYGLDGSVIENMENIWIPITPGTPVVFENIPVGTYVIGEDSAAAAVSGYKLDETNSVLESGEFLIVEDVISAVELKNVYLKVYPYRNEWWGNRWYNADGTQNYAPLGSWKHNAKGYWFGDTSGWYAKNCWQKINGKSYYFAADGYMETNCYRNGYYLTKSGAYDGKGKAAWQHNSTGWWYKLPDGTYLKNTWAVIDGKWYYFKSNGYAAANEWVKGYYWINANMTWTYKPKGSWHKTANGWWFGDSSGWYAKNATYVIDGKSYTFNAYGYWKQK